MDWVVMGILMLVFLCAVFFGKGSIGSGGYGGFNGGGCGSSCGGGCGGGD
jgi:hypothetical protein